MTVQKNVLEYQMLAPVFALIFAPALFTLTGMATIICGITAWVDCIEIYQFLRRKMHLWNSKYHIYMQLGFYHYY